MFLHTSGRGFPFSTAYRNRLSHINAVPLQRKSVPEKSRKKHQKFMSSCLLSACWPLAKKKDNYVHHAPVWGFHFATGASKLFSSTAYLAEEGCVRKKHSRNPIKKSWIFTFAFNPLASWKKSAQHTSVVGFPFSTGASKFVPSTPSLAGESCLWKNVRIYPTKI